MYKAIIADDEPKICQLLLELGDWKRFDIEVVAVCHDGEEALEAIQKLQPDIVLTDVRMPVFDGLELIRRANEAGLHPAFIIISGYKYFDYAYSAFKYGVIDYLLKPIDQKQMNEILEKTCGILEQQSAFHQAEAELRRLNEHIEISRRKQMFQDLLQAGESFPRSREAFEERYSKRLRGSCLQMLFLETNRSLEAESSQLLVQKLEKRLKTALLDPDGTPAGRVCMETAGGGLAVLLDFEPEKKEAVRSRLVGFLHDARELAGVFGNSWVSMGLSTVCASEETALFPERFREAMEGAKAKVVLGPNRLIERSVCRFSAVDAEHLLGEGSRRSLHHALETLSTDLYTEVLERLAEKSDIQPPLRPAVLRELQELILGAFENYGAAQPEEIGWAQLKQDWEWALEKCVSVQEFYDVMSEKGSHCIQEWRARKTNREKLPIRLAKAWIEEHYGEAISLELVAEQVGLSPTYFSTSFRQVEGRTFSDYLTEIRMKAARELLAGTDMTNYEIAAQVGYTDEKYFGKVFKKEVGIRPGEYRKLYRR